MRAARTPHPALIVAAQAGDRRALDEVVTAHLPFVYTIVRRALGGHPDVDDVVQDIMLRALRQLGLLRAPESFRPWLAAIAVRQVSTHLRRSHLAAERTAALDEAADLPDVDAEIETVTLLEAELSDQRRQVVRASRWLDPDDRALLSLWWLETAGQLTRSELATAVGLSVAHAGVRVQRMRDQLDLSRSVVAALDARPGCAGLRAVVTGWDGMPSPLWRKRIARHTRSCPACAAAADEMVAPEGLLGTYGLLPVPVALTAALINKGTLTGTAAGAMSTTAVPGAASAGASAGGVAGTSAGGVAGACAGGAAAGKAGLLGHALLAVGGHPVAAAVAVGALVIGATVITTRPEPGPSAPTVVAAPTGQPTRELPATLSPGPTATGPLASGPVSLESVNVAGRFVATAGFEGVLAPIGPGGGPIRERATFEVIPAGGEAGCFLFRNRDGWYLRHSSWRLRLSLNQGTAKFRGDATFCVRTNAPDGSVSLEASNYRGWFLRHRGGELWVDQSDGSATFHADSSFLVRPPLVG